MDDTTATRWAAALIFGTPVAALAFMNVWDHFQDPPAPEPEPTVVQQTVTLQKFVYRDGWAVGAYLDGHYYPSCNTPALPPCWEYGDMGGGWLYWPDGTFDRFWYEGTVKGK